ncbi:MAG: hypothetical protein Q4G24_13705 [Paracoccus sp. (in: a-proteobacteria)]|uniref:hypothetical protein n=1 Tax=Paracoccus sp. TaxID=267 RepID=UPI0026E0BB0F|nr:hypothetical protein [Paracoccus sp. (in: a-proteobacteria)]MDO5622514.1 hypothetical protein [Paracoccus sp. (in: a-proteobacteria)]
MNILKPLSIALIALATSATVPAIAQTSNNNQTVRPLPPQDQAQRPQQDRQRAMTRQRDHQQAGRPQGQRPDANAGPRQDRGQSDAHRSERRPDSAGARQGKRDGNKRGKHPHCTQGQNCTPPGRPSGEALRG